MIEAKAVVLVEVRGGVAYVAAAGDVAVAVVDYDNVPGADVPAGFRELNENHPGIFEVGPGHAV